MTLRILGSALFALLLAAACIPQSLPGDSSSASIPPPPPPPLTAQASASAYTPTPQSLETPTTVQPADAPAIPSGDCVVFGAPPPLFLIPIAGLGTCSFACGHDEHDGERK